jgi:hypothetical protein
LLFCRAAGFEPVTENCFLMPRRFIDAARVMENWFWLPLILAPTPSANWLGAFFNMEVISPPMTRFSNG